MALKRIMLDTNAYSALANGDQQVLQLIKAAEQVYLPSFVVAELYFGFKKGSKEQWNREILAEFEAYAKVNRHYPGEETLNIFAELMTELKHAGTPIPTHDVWIAAAAIELGCTLVSYDKHFLAVKKVRLWKA